jgi:hypothetical protein
VIYKGVDKALDYKSFGEDEVVAPRHGENVWGRESNSQPEGTDKSETRGGAQGAI